MKTTPSAEQLKDHIDPSLNLEKIKLECQILVKKRAKISAGVAVVPIPFFDTAIDAGMLTQLLPEISLKFGLIDEQQAKLEIGKDARWDVVKAKAFQFAGLMATRGIVKKTIQGFGGRIIAKQVTKFVPLGGQMVSATLGYMIFKKIAFDHIDECYKLAKDIQKKSASQPPKQTQNTVTASENNQSKQTTDVESSYVKQENQDIKDVKTDVNTNDNTNTTNDTSATKEPTATANNDGNTN